MSGWKVAVALVDRDAETSSARTSIGRLPALAMLVDALEAAGHECITYAELLRVGPAGTVILWDFGSISVLPSNLAAVTGGRIISWSLESPLVAHRAYHRIEEIHTSSAHLFAFPGVADLLSEPGDTFHPLGWPNHRRVVAPVDGERPVFLVMINSNKNVTSLRHAVSGGDPKTAVRAAGAALLARTYGIRGSWSSPDLYTERLRALDHFCRRPGFELYGVGWDQPVPGASRSLRSRIEGCYGGSVGDKDATLRRSAFALCFENTSFPGYITEKIFDCLFAGAVPVYRGAPDVTRYIPSGAFVDATRFATYAELERFLRALPAGDVDAMRREGQDFLRSPAFETFTAERFVEQMVDAVNDVVSKQSSH